jgi:hypothetical protein
MKTTLIVVDEDARGDVHGIAKQKPFANAALLQARFDLRSDVEELPPLRDLEPKFFSERFHVRALRLSGCRLEQKSAANAGIQLTSCCENPASSHDRRAASGCCCSRRVAAH